MRNIRREHTTYIQRNVVNFIPLEIVYNVDVPRNKNQNQVLKGQATPACVNCVGDRRLMARHVQRSRLNSIADDIYDYSAFKISKSFRLSRQASKNLIIEEKSSNIRKTSDLEVLQYEADEEYEEEWRPQNKKFVPTRTAQFLLEYKQFKAARCIQRFVRGWLARVKYENMRIAAIFIQTEWRRFHAQRSYYRKIEYLTQMSTEKYYYTAAVRIQSLWRGWWVREHVHDHQHLIRLQLSAGEELLHCVAFKLHHLIRTHQIPGIYSIRNSKAFSKVEKLLASLTFKTCTERVHRAHDYRQNQVDEAKKLFKKSAYATRVPFMGPNINNICVPKCIPLYNEKDADRKMTKILRMYEAASKKDPRVGPSKKGKHDIGKKYRGLCKPPPNSFCGDVVHSMKKWKIIGENKKEIDPNIFQQPQNVENFLQECKSWWSLLQGQCSCRPDCVQDKSKKDLKQPPHTGST